MANAALKPRRFASHGDVARSPLACQFRVRRVGSATEVIYIGTTDRKYAASQPLFGND